jgi:Spy/CpxP family protein refolding chaperone
LINGFGSSKPIPKPQNKTPFPPRKPNPEQTKHMKTTFPLLVISSSLLLGAPALRAQNNVSTGTQTGKHQRAFEGEQLILPAGVREKLHLTDEQKAELKPIEDDFANTSEQYQVANQPRINAALEANRQARASKDTAQIQAARKQLQDVWAGLQPYRTAAVNQIKPLLTPDQLTILEDPKSQWREDHADEANDPSAN